MRKDFSVLESLRKEMCEQFGSAVATSTDCNLLAQKIKEKTQKAVSPQTLRRFFGLITSVSQTSNFTLNILSQYCGFRDFAGFCASLSNQELEIFFDSEEDPSKNYWRKSEELCQKISAHPELLVNIHQKLMGLPLARKSFIENHPMRDMLGTVYSRYFADYLKYNTTVEAKIFAYGFLFQSAFLTENYEMMEIYFRKIQETQLSAEVHVIPAGMKFGIMLLFADFSHNEELFQNTFSEMKNAREHYIEASKKSVCSFEYSVLELLIFTERTAEINFLMDHNTQQSKKDLPYVPQDRKETHDEVWKILCASALQKSGKKKEAFRKLKSIRIEKLGVGWSKYYSIHYYHILLKINEGTDASEIISKIQTLIDETSFSYFKKELYETEQQQVSYFAMTS